MSSELLKKHAADRPVAIVQDGWTIFVSIRDAEYLRLMKVWKHKMAAAHPDKGGTNTKFRHVRAAFVRWRMEEAAWYANLRLLPPDGWQGAARLLERRRRLRGLPDGTQR